MDFGVLDEELRYAKNHPFKVRLEFDHRFRVWQEIIHRNRRQHLEAVFTREEFESLHSRYIELDRLDVVRLKRRAHREFIYHVTDANEFAIVAYRQILLYRIAELDSEFTVQLLKYDEIGRKWFKPHTYIYEHIVRKISGGR